MNHQIIIHIANYAAPYKGNFIASLEILEKKLEEHGHNSMIYIFPETCKKTSWINEFMEGHKVYFVLSPGKIRYIFFDKRLIKQLKEIFMNEKPSVIHSHFDGYDEYCVKANCVGAEIIWHEHNTRVLVDNKIKQIYQKASFFYQYSIMGRKVHIIALYKKFEKFLRQYGYLGDILLLPNSIAEGRIKFCVKRRNQTINFLTFGGRFDDKGIDILLESVQQIRVKNMNVDICFNITEGADTRMCVNQFFNGCIPDEIKLIPQTEHVSELFKNTDCFCAPSRRETFSYAVAEAMLSGTPVITSDLEAVSWAFSQKSVITFKTEHADDLTDKILKFIGGGYSDKELEASKMYVEKNYMTSVWADKLIEYYNKIYIENRDSDKTLE